jgi:molybdate transport system substrate-binding protein
MLRAVHNDKSRTLAVFAFVVLAVATLAALVLTSCTAARDDTRQTVENDEPLTVFVAASLIDLVTDVVAGFQSETGIAVNLSPASSGTLARQIENGADADLFLSASPDWIAYLDDLGLLQRRTVFARNRMVLIAPAGSRLESQLPMDQIRADVETLAAGGAGNPDVKPGWLRGLVSVGDPAHVPAGRYAEQALRSYGWWDEVSDDLLLATDVRMALLAVERGEAELGVVYGTDAVRSQSVVVLATFPERTHDPVEYTCAIVSGAGEDTELLYDYIAESPAVGNLLVGYGFVLPVEPATEKSTE